VHRILGERDIYKDALERERGTLESENKYFGKTEEG
jgi:hypothetical protein